MNTFDKKCLDLALAEARSALSHGNLPVGAVLALDKKIISVGGNTGTTSSSYINHAETRLLHDNVEALLDSHSTRGATTLYSTLEPCLMCLGTAIMCKIDRIVYIQDDPYGGACKIERSHLGDRYQKMWPEIIHSEYSQEQKDLLIEFMNTQISNGVRVEWSRNFLDLMHKLPSQPLL